MFSQRLREAITRSGKTQKQITDETGISPAGLNNYLRGKYSPDIDVALKLARACAVSLAFLVEGQDHPDFPVAKNVAKHAPSSEPVPRVSVAAAFRLLGQTPDELAVQLDATSDQVRSWIEKGVQPPHHQLALLFNAVVTAGLAMRCANTPQAAAREGRSSRATGT